MLFYEEDATFSTKNLKDSVFVQTEIQRQQLWLLMNCLTKQWNVNAHESFTGLRRNPKFKLCFYFADMKCHLLK